MTHLSTVCFLLAASSAVAQSIRINEFVSNAPGPDEGREYFEISGPAGASLDGITLLEIDGDGDAGGNIDAAFDLSGLSLGSNGLLLLRDQPEITITVGENDFTVPAVLNPAPAAGTAVFVDGTNPGDYNEDGFVNAADYTVWRDQFDSRDPETGDPDGSLAGRNDTTPESVTQADYQVWLDNYASPQAGLFFNEDDGGIENGSITFALVSGFTGSRDDDLDTDDDGVLDSTPWDSVVDAVGFDEDGPSDDTSNRSYAAEMGGAEFDGALLSTIAGFGNEPDGYVLLSDGEGGVFPAAFDLDESNVAEPELFFDDGSGLQVIDTSALGPWGLDNGPADPSTGPNDGVLEFVGLDENGDLLFATPDLVEVTGADIGEPSLTVVGADGQPVSLFLASPGNANGSGVLGEAVVPPTPASVPEPGAAALLAIAVAAAGGCRRR